MTVFTTSPDKRREAEKLGAAHVVLEKDAKKQMEKLAVEEGRFDFILSTVPQKHDINPYVVLLKRDAAIVVVGAMEPLAPINNQPVAFHRRHISGSFIGSIRETQEVLDFCAAHDVRPEIEVIAMQDVNEAHARVEDGEVRFRYVIDLATLKQERAERAEHASAIEA